MDFGFSRYGSVKIIDSNDRTVASTHRKWMSMHEYYYIDVFDEGQMDAAVAIFVTLAHMINDKQAAAMATSSSAAGAGGLSNTDTGN